MAQILTTTTTSNPMKMSPLTGPHATKSTKYTQVISKFGKHVPTKPAPGKVSPTSTKIGVWDLKSQEFTELEAPEATESLFNGILDTESVIGIDGRKAIPKKHYAPGGKYRAIVKLFLRFAGQPEGSSWAMATGWLIEKDLLVTAGHCAYDWSHKYGRLTHVKAYVGYSGKESVKDTSMVELRMGIRVASTESWLSKGDTQPNGDVSFIRLNKPFTGVTPIKYIPTPSTGSNVSIGVVGYPGDLMKRTTQEKGALMYEMFLPTSYTLDGSKSKMLQYAIDTYGGNSGSPVLRKSDMSSIGVHVLGGNPNSASVIAGKYGNSFDALRAAIMLKSSGVDSHGIRWLTVPKEAPGGKSTSISPPKPAKTKPTESDFELPDPESEDTPPAPGSEQRATEADVFKIALKKAMDVTTDPLGAIAAYGLHLTSMRVKELSDQEKAGEADGEAGGEADADETSGEVEDPEGDVDDAEYRATDEDESFAQRGEDGEFLGEDEADIDEAAEAAAPAYEGVAERAMLTDAAFSLIAELGPEKCEKLGYFKYMRPYVAKYGRQCSRAGTTIFPHFMAPIFRTTITKLSTPTEFGQTQPAHTEPEPDPNAPVEVEDPPIADFGPRLDAKKEAMIEAFTQGITESSDGGLDPELLEIISKGLRIPGRIIADVAEADLENVFTEALESTSMGDGNESGFEAALEDVNSSEYFYDALAQRALIGEAMLEAIMNTPIESQQQEGIFSSIGKALNKGLTAIGKGARALATATVGGKGAGLLSGVSGWITLGTTGYAVGKAIYDAAKKKKKEFIVDDDRNNETGDGEGSDTTHVEDSWEAFFK